MTLSLTYGKEESIPELREKFYCQEIEDLTSDSQDSLVPMVRRGNAYG